MAVQFAGKIHDKMKNKASLKNLAISYQNIAKVYEAQGQTDVAVAYYEMVKKCNEVLTVEAGLH